MKTLFSRFANDEFRLDMSPTARYHPNLLAVIESTTVATWKSGTLVMDSPEQFQTEAFSRYAAECQTEAFSRYAAECRRMASLARGPEGKATHTGMATNLQHCVERLKQALAALPSAGAMRYAGRQLGLNSNNWVQKSWPQNLSRAI